MENNLAFRRSSPWLEADFRRSSSANSAYMRSMYLREYMFNLWPMPICDISVFCEKNKEFSLVGAKRRSNLLAQEIFFSKLHFTACPGELHACRQASPQESVSQ